LQTLPYAGLRRLPTLQAIDPHSVVIEPHVVMRKVIRLTRCGGASSQVAQMSFHCLVTSPQTTETVERFLAYPFVRRLSTTKRCFIPSRPWEQVL